MSIIPVVVLKKIGEKENNKMVALYCLANPPSEQCSQWDYFYQRVLKVVLQLENRRGAFVQPCL